MAGLGWPAGNAARLAGAQTPLTEGRGLTVAGEASLSVRPDQAIVAAGVMATKPTAAEALAEASRVIELGLKRLDELGIQRANVQTSGLSLSPVYDDPQPGAEPKLVGHRASYQLTITIDDLNKVSPVLDGLVGVGLNQLAGVRFGLKEERTLRTQTLQAATAAARPKAEAMAAGLGLTLGPVLQVREEGVGAVPPLPANEAVRAGVPIEAGQLTLRLRVQVTFALA
jgi:hypothetical protein